METIRIQGLTIPVYRTSVLVLGAGAAGLNAADELAKRGIDVLLAADDFSGGTSRNGGSDKQTYYKLSLSGGADSVDELAQTYMEGGNMDGDTALALAAGSVEAFMKLVQIGVPFPHNEWGEYVGYRTDHDPRNRATSAGPLTSRFMAECLEKEVIRRDVRRVKGSIVRYLTQDRVLCGALLYDPSSKKDADNKGLRLVLCGQAIACTGGSAMLYRDSVFPLPQRGALGAALRAGAAGQNLWSWQYGLASVKHRWNVSGSYQQVLPRYVDENGHEILDGSFKDETEKQDMIFLKGYQWPFDARKSEGSSRVDMAIYKACSLGHRIFMDFRSEDAADWQDKLGTEARTYLENCGCSQQSPYLRLNHMNPASIELYRSFGIDLEKEPLEVAVCAQHTNGGLAVDQWWQTTLKGLYAAGETAGAFGAYRPGGSALNETQVGSIRAVRHIAADVVPVFEMNNESLTQLEEEVCWLKSKAELDSSAVLKELQEGMTLNAGHVRNLTGMRILLERVHAWLDELDQGAGDIDAALLLRDCLFASKAVLSSMICHGESMNSPAGHICTDGCEPLDEKTAKGMKIVTEITRDGEASHLLPVRPLPASGGWFETVWAAYRSGDVNR